MVARDKTVTEWLVAFVRQHIAPRDPQVFDPNDPEGHWPPFPPDCLADSPLPAAAADAAATAARVSHEAHFDGLADALLQLAAVARLITTDEVTGQAALYSPSTRNALEMVFTLAVRIAEEKQAKIIITDQEIARLLDELETTGPR
ncbi:hypothetical protein ACFSSC_10120 [Corynebacterium mendelii]|uniref:Uncharacterized protein n=1 Tax=Corynebacterium mendelii TaxID=2765362 RepID=A0A939E2C2_9CORY|nr:hypothetical protein [Corynebacterium mendelii]MBN9644401.1 hypothetical protein [Corynebacterium mendelii]